MNSSNWGRATAFCLIAGFVACSSSESGTTGDAVDAGAGNVDAGTKRDGGDAGKTTQSDSGTVAQGDASVAHDAAIADSGTKDATVHDASSDGATVPDAAADTGIDSSVPDAGQPFDAGPRLPSTTLVINEIDYDQPVADGAEFLEIFNKSSSPVDLTNFAVAFFNGGNAGQMSSEYLRMDLGPGTLAGGEYLVFAAPAVVDAGAAVSAAIVRTFAMASNNIQNGPRDSIIIFDKTTNEVIDAVTYGSLDPDAGNTLPVNATFPLVEGAMTTQLDSNSIIGSLIRQPNGADTNDNDTDFKFTTTITPGLVNVLTP